MRRVFHSLSAEQTIYLGARFSSILRPGDVVVLEGELGGGKTTFVKGVLKGLGYHKRVLSPTFGLIRQHRVKGLDVYHIDLYRLSYAACGSLGLDEILYAPCSLVFIEWGDKLAGDLDYFFRVRFLFKDEHKRRISFFAAGCSEEGKSRLMDFCRDAENIG